MKDYCWGKAFHKVLRKHDKFQECNSLLITFERNFIPYTYKLYGDMNIAQKKNCKNRKLSILWILLIFSFGWCVGFDILFLFGHRCMFSVIGPLSIIFFSINITFFFIFTFASSSIAFRISKYSIWWTKIHSNIFITRFMIITFQLYLYLDVYGYCRLVNSWDCVVCLLLGS